MRRYSLDQIGLNIVANLGNGLGDNHEADKNNNNNNNASEATPHNSTKEADDKTVEPVKPKKRLSKVADYIKIDYDDLGKNPVDTLNRPESISEKKT